MKKYNYKKGKSAKEKVGFYAALSVCVIAVVMAVWSTYSNYNDLTDSKNDYSSSLDKVNGHQEDVATNATVAQSDDDISDDNPADRDEVAANASVFATEPIQTPTQQETKAKEVMSDEEILQTALNLEVDLSYPVKSPKITKGFSEQGVYNKTMGDYRAHAGIDLSAQKGEQVFSMCTGKVTNVYTDALLGNVVEVTNGEIKILYCGLDEVSVSAEESVEASSVLGTAGKVPYEEKDGEHIHIALMIKDKYVDPLTLISKNE